jgi:hypothetical protein
MREQPVRVFRGVYVPVNRIKCTRSLRESENEIQIQLPVCANVRLIGTTISGH